MPLFTFTSGSEEQKERYRRAVTLMQNLPVESIAASVSVSFIPYAELEDQTDLAETFWTYGSSVSETRVRFDYPLFGGGDGKLESLEAEAGRFGVPYDGLLHANETPVHELGHSIFAALPENVRLKIAQLFGLDSIEQADLFPVSEEWANRVGEGIADTFKEAFLPSRFRVFPNRTNRRISYNDFPQFRRLFRNIIGEGTDSDCYIYGSGANRRPDVEEKLGAPSLPVHFSTHDAGAFVEYQEIKDFEHGWGVHMGQFKEAGKLPFTIEPAGGGAS